MPNKCHEVSIKYKNDIDFVIDKYDLSRELIGVMEWLLEEK